MGKKLASRLPHPRNIYREKPNIKELAVRYPEFRKYAVQSLDGRVTMNFKDKDALCALTKVLLKKDFSLNIDIPPDRLVPTVPLRLNYLLWIEDLLEILTPRQKSNVYGIDIGTGASCIYALLAARKNGYRMLATEVDETNFTFASKNVIDNNLQKLIKVKKVSQDVFLFDALDSNVDYDFCMCNPPFFNVHDQDQTETEDRVEMTPSIKAQDRTGHRLPPKSVPTGSMVELATSGGEVAFIDNIINDSVRLKNKIKIYTTMVGHRSNVDKLLDRLVKLDGISKERVTVSPFHQGNVTRWGIAWTFIDSIDFSSFNCGKVLVQNKRPSKPPVNHIFENTKLEDAITRVRFLLDRIQILKKITVKRDNEYGIEITSYEECWKNQRKRRREEERKMKENESKKNKICDVNNSGNNRNCVIDKEVEMAGCPLNNPSSCVLPDSSNCQKVINTNSEINCLLAEGENNTFSEVIASSDLNQNIDSSLNKVTSSSNKDSSSIDSEKPLILHAILLLKMNSENSVLLQFSSLGGTGGWNAVHQILTYLKNHWNRNLSTVLLH